MQLLSKAELKSLINLADGPSVSLYLPTQVAGPETRQNPILFKNLVREAEAQLQDSGLSSSEIASLLEPATTLLEGHFEFWQHQDHGLAFFLTRNGSRSYRLPLSFDALAVVSDQLHLTPLMPLFSGTGYFYILALSQEHVRLFQATEHAIAEISLEEVPKNIDEALQYDTQEDLERRQATASGVGGSSGTYHGQGIDPAIDKESIHQYFLVLDKALHPYLREETAPLVLACVDYQHSIFKSASKYNHLLDQHISGSPEIMKPEELHTAAWPLVEPYFREAQEQAVNQFHELQGTGKAGVQIEQIVPAAYRGQIDTLFTVANVHCWGQYDPDTDTLEQHEPNQPEDSDLLNFAAVQTLLQGGTVFVVDQEEMPEDAPVAAIYRYGLPTEVEAAPRQ
ncbi:MAG: hypothetical protein ICV77_03790 [Cyanobacteria bacterium Co-bin8]|nr:hypothetical protein [Cyanobacteria bacterium Co-bin8]